MTQLSPTFIKQVLNLLQALVMITGEKAELARALGRWLGKHAHLYDVLCTAMCWRIEFQQTSDHTHRRRLIKCISHWNHLIVSIYSIYVGKLRKSSSKYFFHIWGEVTQETIIRGIWGNALMNLSYLAFSHLVINWAPSMVGGDTPGWWLPWAGILGSIRSGLSKTWEVSQ